MLTKNALTELYSNISYITPSGVRDFRFEAVSDLVAKLSFLWKQATSQNIEETEKAHIQNTININDGLLFNPKIEDPLDIVTKILDDPDAEHKKEMFPYVLPQVQTPE